MQKNIVLGALLLASTSFIKSSYNNQLTATSSNTASSTSSGILTIAKTFSTKTTNQLTDTSSTSSGILSIANTLGDTSSLGTPKKVLEYNQNDTPEFKAMLLEQISPINQSSKNNSVQRSDTETTLSSFTAESSILKTNSPYDTEPNYPLPGSADFLKTQMLVAQSQERNAMEQEANGFIDQTIQEETANFLQLQLNEYIDLQVILRFQQLLAQKEAEKLAQERLNMENEFDQIREDILNDKDNSLWDLFKTQVLIQTEYTKQQDIVHEKLHWYLKNFQLAENTQAALLKISNSQKTITYYEHSPRQVSFSDGDIIVIIDLIIGEQFICR